MLFLVVIPVITLVGVFGNCVSLVVMHRLRDNSVWVMTSALAVADSVVLIMDFVQNWLELVTHMQIRNISAALCGIYRY